MPGILIESYLEDEIDSVYNQEEYRGPTRYEFQSQHIYEVFR